MKPTTKECSKCYAPGYPEFSGLCRRHWGKVCKDAVKAERLLAKFPPDANGEPNVRERYILMPAPLWRSVLFAMIGGAIGSAAVLYAKTRFGW